VFVAPVPVVFLIVLVQMVIVAVQFVAFGPVASVHKIFVVIPGVVVAVIFIVDLDASSATGTRDYNQETYGKAC
jgi:hypothetical protein